MVAQIPNVISYAIIAMVIGVCVSQARRPIHLYGLFMLLIPLDTQVKLQVGGPSISAADIVLLVLLAMFLIGMIDKNNIANRFKSTYRVMLILSIYISFALVVSILLFVPTVQGIGVFFSRTMAVFLVLLSPLVIKSVSDIRIVFKYWCVGALISSIVGITQSLGVLPIVIGEVNNYGRTFLGFTFPFKRSVGLFTIHSYYGSYVFPVLCYVIFELINSRKTFQKSNFFFLTVLTVVLVGVLFTQSRSTWLALLVGLFAYLVFYCIAVRRYSYKNVFAILASVAGIIFLAPRIFTFNTIDSFVGMRRQSVDGRMEQWEIAWNAFITNPFFGIGPKQYKLLDGDHVLHNMYLLVLVEQGLLGGIAMLIFIFYPFFKIFSQALNSSSGGFRVLSAAIAASLVSIYCEVSFAGGLPYLSVWAALGMAIAIANLSIRDGSRNY